MIKKNDTNLLKKLNTEIINNILNMSNENIIHIINAYNDVTDAFNKL